MKNKNKEFFDLLFDENYYKKQLIIRKINDFVKYYGIKFKKLKVYLDGKYYYFDLLDFEEESYLVFNDLKDKFIEYVFSDMSDDVKMKHNNNGSFCVNIRMKIFIDN